MTRDAGDGPRVHNRHLGPPTLVCWRRSVRVVGWLSCVVMVGFGVLLHAQQSSFKHEDSPFGTMLVIEGKDTPEAIPQHCYWRHVFLKLSSIKKLESGQPWLERIGLSPAELAQVLEVAKAQEQRDNDCLKGITDKQDELKRQHATPDAINQVYYDQTIECRSRDLAARDALLEHLTPEGRERLVAWAEATRRSMTVHIRADEFDHFKKPY
jgi:hypothetical protein